MKIKYLPCQPHCFGFGGFDLQMIHTLEAVKKAGVSGEKLNPWDRDSDFDIIHLWGLDSSNFRSALFAKKANKKIVLTALTGYVGPFKSRIINYLVNRFQLFNYNREIIKLIDSFVVLNEGQKEAAIKLYNVPEKIISIIPAIVHSDYFDYKNTENVFFNCFGFTKFILTTGNVGYRKNQINLAKACIRLNKKLVIIGNVAIGEEIYGLELEELVAVNDNILWIREIENNSNLLISAYSECELFCLVSRDEQQPISPLEAAVLGKPLLLANKTYARQIYFKNACLTDPDSIEAIMSSIIKILVNPANYVTPISHLKEFKSESVGENYKELYNSLI